MATIQLLLDRLTMIFVLKPASYTHFSYVRQSTFEYLSWQFVYVSN